MKFTIFQYTESPLILEEVTEVWIEEDGSTLTIIGRDGRVSVDVQDVMRIEITDEEK